MKSRKWISWVAAWALAAGMVSAGSLPATSLPAGHLGTLAGQPLPAKADGKAPYLVSFKQNFALGSELAGLRSSGIAAERTFPKVLNGFSANLTSAQVAALSKNPKVDFIERDSYVTISETAQSWGLDRIDQTSLPLNGTYNFARTGSGVTAYIVDTGILANHSEFTGRLITGMTAINDGRGTTDCNGHGSHVAGTVGGTKYGVAKSVTLVPVRVLDCNGSGSWSGVIAGLEWIANQHQGAGGATKAVANMSLGGGASSSIDAAVANLSNLGVTVVVAAGNSSKNACNYSPAREPSAVTVGATTNSDARASYSNFGSCLDIFAPGSSIKSAWYTSSTSTNTISGTSMASPHVAGAVALFLESGAASPASVSTWVKSVASTGKVTSAGSGSPNLLLNTSSLTVVDVGGGGGTDPEPEATAPSAPTSLAASAGNNSVTLSWRLGANGGSALTEHRIYLSNGTYLGSVSGTATRATVSGLTRRTTYSFYVRAVNVVGESPSSNTVTIRTK